uniref:Uncharacterized protein n=1 Tax=Chelonoidis abingdonii TaxID=106734 RepID=A0A8C0HFM0_CHEAB
MTFKRYFIRVLHRLQKGPGYTYKSCWSGTAITPTRMDPSASPRGQRRKSSGFFLTLVSSSLSIGFKTMKFPAVTVCNMDELTEAALERILQSKHGDAISAPPLNSSETIPLVLIDESDPDHPVIIDLFETNQSGSGTNPTILSALSNVTSEGKEHQVAVKLVSGGLWLPATCSALRSRTRYIVSFGAGIVLLPAQDEIRMGYQQGHDLACLLWAEPAGYRYVERHRTSAYSQWSLETIQGKKKSEDSSEQDHFSCVCTC